MWFNCCKHMCIGINRISIWTTSSTSVTAKFDPPENIAGHLLSNANASNGSCKYISTTMDWKAKTDTIVLRSKDLTPFDFTLVAPVYGEQTKNFIQV